MDPNRFFGHAIDVYSTGGKAFALILAVFLGGLIGIEREIRGQAAGLRTHILVCVGSALITLTSVEIGILGPGNRTGDPARLAAQIVSGIGFLGAGAIMREGMSVHGLTTAASIWTVAAIGIALGASPHLGELAVVSTLIVLGTLTVVTKLEEVLRIKRRSRSLIVEVREANHGPARILEILTTQGIVVYGIESSVGKTRSTGGNLGATRQMRMVVSLPVAFDRGKLTEILTEAEGVVSFEME